MNNIFSENLKKFRLAKGFTQEQVAEKLNVNSQTVSRWECSATLPDVLTLPELARLYEVTVDDFYKKNSVAYDNYAQRLASVYENSRDPEDFMRCRIEYEKLMKNGELSTADKWQYGWIHMYMMNYCRDIAVEWYDKAVSDNPNDDPENYHIACMQRIWMFFLLKKEDEIISELREKVKSNPDNPRETDNLLVALIWAEKYDDAYNLFRDAIKKFPDDWRMYIHGGDIAKNLKKYDEALEYYDKAGEIGTYFCDEMDCKAGLYKETGEFEKAYNEYMKMADIYRSRGYDVEADMMEKHAEEVKNCEIISLLSHRTMVYNYIGDNKAEKREMPMNTFDNEVKQRWGNTDAYKEIKRKTADYSADKWNDVNAGLNAVLAGFALALKGGETPENQTAQLLVGKLQQYITDNFYTCTDEILAGLGQMYAADDRFKTSIDKNGEGTAEFISEAIKIYCK